jgi:general secretion pathway protein D
LQYPKYNPLILGLLLAGFVTLSGCANTLSESRELIAAGKPELGLEHLREGMVKDPGNIEIRQTYYTERERVVNSLLLSAQDDLQAEHYDDAETKFKKILAIDPQNPRARSAMNNLASTREHGKLLAEANQALADGKPDAADGKARLVMAQTLSSPAAQKVLRRAQATHTEELIAPRKLDGKYQKKVTLEFRDAPIRNVFDMISRQSGINFVFDRDVRLDTKATLFARNTSIDTAIEMLLSTGSLSKRIVSKNTLLIYPNQIQKQKEYKELMVKGFYLGNADAKSTLIMLKTLLKSRDVYMDERLNMLIMRDTPEAIRLAEKTIALMDMAEPEVMLEVEILEVKRSKLTAIGVQYPNQFGLLNTITTTTVVPTNGGAVTSANTTLSTLPLTLDKLIGIPKSAITVSPSPLVNLQSDDSDVNILANPRIRVKDHEKAKIHIGDKVPVITSNATSTGVISESVSYLDVGLKLDVQPQVMQHNDVQMKVDLEVSNIVKQITGASGSLTYQIGTRNASTTLRLRDGETQVLAGLISDEDRKSASRIPGLGDLPVLGHLFSTRGGSRDKTEIVLLITPHVIRQLSTDQPALTEFTSGTDNAIGETLPTFGDTSGPDNTTPASISNADAPGSSAASTAPISAAPVSNGAVDLNNPEIKKFLQEQPTIVPVPANTPPEKFDPTTMAPGYRESQQTQNAVLQQLLREQQAQQAQQAAEAKRAAEEQRAINARPSAPDPSQPQVDPTPQGTEPPPPQDDSAVQTPPPFDPSGDN